MRLYNDDPDLKAELVARAESHRIGDRVVQGTYFERYSEDDWKGCAIGCLANGMNNVAKGTVHSGQERGAKAIERDFSIPEYLAYWAEAAFEGQTRDKAWPEKFAMAIPVGVELTNEDVREWAFECVRAQTSAEDFDSKAEYEQWLKGLGAYGMPLRDGTFWNSETRAFLLEKLASITPDEEQERVENAIAEIVERDAAQAKAVDAIAQTINANVRA